MTKTTSIEREDVLLRARAEAEADLRELKRRSTTARAALRQAVAAREAHIKRYAADHWTPNLEPASPQAEALTAEIAALQASDDLALGDRIRHAEGVLEGTRRELQEFRQANAQALAEELTKAGDLLADELNELIRESAPALLERAASGVASAAIDEGPGRGNPDRNPSGKCPPGQNTDTSVGGLKKCG